MGFLAACSGLRLRCQISTHRNPEPPSLKGYREEPLEGTLNLIPLYDPYIYLKQSLAPGPFP